MGRKKETRTEPISLRVTVAMKAELTEAAKIFEPASVPKYIIKVLQAALAHRRHAIKHGKPYKQSFKKKKNENL